jgi:hypothetical protein
LWLALALVAAPQLSYLHALSHHTVASAGQAGDDHRQQPFDKACEVCLSLAHLGHALAGEHGWLAVATPLVAPDVHASASIAARAPAHFQARAPPSFL